MTSPAIGAAPPGALERLRALAGRVALSEGRERALLAVLAGALAALAMPPLYLWPALALALPVAVWLIDGAAAGSRLASARRAAGLGWLFGFGTHLAGLWWVGAAFLVEQDEFAWALPFGVLGLPAGLALFHALGFGLARLLWSPGAWRVLALAFGLGLAEWLRGHVLTGFPWNPVGQAFGATSLSSQAAALAGVEGLTVVALAMAAALALPATGATARARWAGPALAGLALLGLIAFGAARLAGPVPEDAPGVRLRLVQPGVSQRDKNGADSAAAVLRRHLELSDRATSPTTSGVADATHVIWPESAIPALLEREPAMLAAIATTMGRAVLVTGAVRAEGTGARARYFNAIQAIQGGRVVATYDKHHLVPFGEYLPLRSLFALAGLRAFVEVPGGGFVPGAGGGVLSAPGLPPARGLVCYEAVFPDEGGAASGGGEPRPAWLLNVTNDGWFGLTPGPRQHAEMARLRAVEQGLPMVRAANTGVSFVADALGRVRASLPLGARGVIDAGLPGPLPPPPFARYGGWVVAALLGLAGLGALAGAAAGRRR